MFERSGGLVARALNAPEIFYGAAEEMQPQSAVLEKLVELGKEGGGENECPWDP